MNIAHPNFLKFTEKLKGSIGSYLSIREEILYEQDINPNSRPFDSVNFARYILTNGTIQEKRDLVTALDRHLYIKNRFITTSY
ncbi:MAG: hypothetical protein ACR2LN_07000 [Candidatus Levyibacteriota bacterium]